MTAPEERKALIGLINEATLAGARQAHACKILGLSARTVQRWYRGEPDAVDGRTLRHHEPRHKLSAEERAELLAVANSAEFGHLPPSQIVPRLADRQRYIASESTFYRVPKAEKQLAHRRSERPAHSRSKPRSVCTDAPNQLYSWDITYLPTTVRGQYFYLYLFLDVFSRKIVGWQVYAEESSVLASEVLKDLCAREAIQANQVILYSDNGGPMKGATKLATLQALGVMPSLSRPGVSNDNPYSESLFKTLKYRRAYPLKAFDALLAARTWVGALVCWYNHEHRHSAIQFVTPAQRHANLDQDILDRRVALYETARQRNPLRWKGPTRNWQRVDAAHLNPDRIDDRGIPQQRLNQERKAG
ncbi:transposase InsO family protein [Paraburkholderia unamae]|uniref:Transposase InsO family protein n=1 Tax=Paraburkholderia unamae TaxID=219649 RepID=A0ABX5KBI1_9BURK|nr:transposase InsO family protein [Paraburkholderia unamae]